MVPRYSTLIDSGRHDKNYKCQTNQMTYHMTLCFGWEEHSYVSNLPIMVNFLSILYGCRLLPSATHQIPKKQWVPMQHFCIKMHQVPNSMSLKQVNTKVPLNVYTQLTKAIFKLEENIMEILNKGNRINK